MDELTREKVVFLLDVFHALDVSKRLVGSRSELHTLFWNVQSCKKTLYNQSCSRPARGISALSL